MSEVDQQSRLPSTDQHTPGPWTVSEYMDDGRLGVLSEKNEILCAVSVGLKPADAALIAAAPDLLEALELMVALPVRYNANRIEIDCGSHGEAMEIVRKARAAVAKAEGRS